MRIERVRCRATRPAAGDRPAQQQCRLVLVEVEGGLIGVGAAAAAGEEQAHESDLAPAALAGRDLRECQALCRELAAALPSAATRAAVDIALHDALAQALGLPLADLLGRAHVCLPGANRLPAATPETTAELAAASLRCGFRHLRVTLCGEHETDVERLLRLREAVGRKARLGADAGALYAPEGLRRLADDTATAGLDFIACEVAPNSIDALLALPADRRAVLAVTASGEAAALRLLASPAGCGLLRVDLAASGGIRAALRLATLAEAADARVVWKASSGGTLATAAALHAALATPSSRHLDVDARLLPAADVSDGCFELRDGHLSCGPLPGLGLGAETREALLAGG